MRWRPGIALQLTCTFVAIAVLVLTANFAAQRTVSITTTRVRTLAPVAVAAKPVATAPLPIELPVPTRPDPTAEQRGKDFVRAADHFDGMFVTRLVTQSAESMQAFAAAGTQLQRAAELAAQQSPDRRALLLSLKALLVSADSAAALADRRRETFENYVQRIEDMNARMQRSIDGAWKIMGRVVARQSVVSLNQRLSDIRRSSSAFSKPDGYDAALQQQMQASEDEFLAALARERDSLGASQGEQWVGQMQDDATDAAALRATMVKLDEQLRDDRATLSAQGAALRTQIANRRIRQVAAPVRAAAKPAVAEPLAPMLTASVPEESTSTVVDPGDTGAKRRFAILSGAALLLVLLISIATGVSIVAPVRRLIHASQRVAKGDVGVRVPRGGNRELDGLAVAFNDMAEQLAAAQTVALGYQSRLESDVHERTQQLQHQALHDPLTALPNRRQLLTHLEAAVATAAARGELVGVYFLDLDNFKNINDGMGHALGDRLLCAIAERLRQTLGSTGFAARLGGDEFTLVHRGGRSMEDMAEIGWSLVRAFQQPLQIDGRDLLVSVSVGAGFYPDHACDADALLRTADAALFRAKALGRSQLTVFTPDLLEAAAAKFSTEQGLRLAVDRGELELYYQPEVSLDTLETTVVEALLRWRTSDGRHVSPGEFLAVAEESGLIIEINDWVLRSGISTAARWHRDGWENVRVAINVSARQLFDVEFADRVQALLQEHSLPPRCLEIELTESVLQTGATTVTGLKRLQQMGVAISLDDFGTGYSSLASLEQLPLTRVKLDRSLIASIDTNPRSAAIAAAIIGLCQDLGMEITAEGIERPAQLAALRDTGITLQGFLIACPAPERELLAIVERLPSVLQQLLLEAPTAIVPVGARTVISSGTSITDTQRRRRLVLASP